MRGSAGGGGRGGGGGGGGGGTRIRPDAVSAVIGQQPSLFPRRLQNEQRIAAERRLRRHIVEAPFCPTEHPGRVIRALRDGRTRRECDAHNPVAGPRDRPTITIACAEMGRMRYVGRGAATRSSRLLAPAFRPMSRSCPSSPRWRGNASEPEYVDGPCPHLPCRSRRR